MSCVIHAGAAVALKFRQDCNCYELPGVWEASSRRIYPWEVKFAFFENNGMLALGLQAPEATRAPRKSFGMPHRTSDPALLRRWY